MIKYIRMGFEIMKAIKFMFNYKAEAFNPTTTTKFLARGILPLIA